MAIIIPMKKLLIISTNTIHVVNYIHLIRDYFDEIHLITNTKEEIFFYGDVKISYTDFSIRNPISFYKSIGFIRNIINKENPSIIHVQQITNNAFLTILANRKKNIPAIYTAWGSDVLINPNKSFLLSKMIKYILRHAQYFTSDSKFMSDVMDKMAGRKLNTLIANFGINIECSKIAEKQNVIYSNRQLKKLYRIDKIIEAFARFMLNKKSNDWKLIIGADGEEILVLKALTKKLKIENSVDFVGWLNKEQNSYYYNVAKYYISIPESDATSISLLEAMALGCIPILSDLPANREWVEHGRNGIIVNNLNHNFIEEALKIDYNAAIDINSRIIAEHGTKEANREKFIKFYEQIISKAL